MLSLVKNFVLFLCRSFIGADCTFEEWKRVYDAFSSTWGYGMMYFIAMPCVSKTRNEVTAWPTLFIQKREVCS